MDEHSYGSFPVRARRGQEAGPLRDRTRLLDRLRRRRRVVVVEGAVGVLRRDGAAVSVLGVGEHLLAARREELLGVDVRAAVRALPGHEVLTADGASLKVSVQWLERVVDPLAVLVTAQAPGDVVHARAAAALRAAVAGQALEALVREQAEVAAAVADAVVPTARGLGLEVTEVTVRDLMPAGELRAAMAEVAVARSRGQAELERARAEGAALRSLANAARLLDGNPSLAQLRTLQAAAGSGMVVLHQGTSGVPGTDGSSGRESADGGRQP